MSSIPNSLSCSSNFKIKSLIKFKKSKSDKCLNIKRQI